MVTFIEDYLSTLVLEATSSARRVPLHPGAGRIELTPGVAFRFFIHPTDLSRLSLENVGTGPWQITMPDGHAAKIAPGGETPLAHGCVIDFGPIRGRVEFAG